MARAKLQRQFAVDMTTQSEMNVTDNITAKRQIKTHCSEIIRNLYPEEIVDFLFEKRIINDDFCATIRKHNGMADRSRELVHILLETKHPTACFEFREALRSTHAFLIVILEKPSNTCVRLTKFDQVPDCQKMKGSLRGVFDDNNESIKQQLEQNMDRIASSVHPKSIMDSLISMSIITSEDRVRLMAAGPTRQDQFWALWNHLKEINHPCGFILLKEILEREDHRWIFEP